MEWGHGLFGIPYLWKVPLSTFNPVKNGKRFAKTCTSVIVIVVQK